MNCRNGPSIRKISEYNLKEKEQARKNWIGRQKRNSKGTLMTVIDYYNRNKIRIRFEDEKHYEKDVCTSAFCKGNVSNPYDKTVFGVGVVGESNTICKKNEHKQKLSYLRWVGILERCYSPKRGPNHKTYSDCTVCEEWLFYPNFEKWFNENYYKIPGCRMDIDKDIKIKGNKVYSPDACLIVPSAINMLPISRKSARNGVIGTHISENGRFEACHNVCENGVVKRLHLGTYNTADEAFKHYKESKKTWIVKVANKYKQYMPKSVYEVVINYEVDIND